MSNEKSDVNAKQAFCNELLINRGFDTAEVVSSPTDICAMKNGQKWYFEIKMTKCSDIYFGAATETEWEQAFKDPEHFRFIVVQTDENDSFYKFLEFTPAEFMRGCTIPPFKVYFNVNMKTGQMVDKSASQRAIIFSKERFMHLHEAYQFLKSIRRNNRI